MPANEDVDAAEDSDHSSSSSRGGRINKAGWFLSTLGYKGRSDASQHVKNWREGVLLEDESVSGRGGRERRGSLNPGGGDSSTAENSVRAGGRDVYSRTFLALTQLFYLSVTE